MMNQEITEINHALILIDLAELTTDELSYCCKQLKASPETAERIKGLIRDLSSILMDLDYEVTMQTPWDATVCVRCLNPINEDGECSTCTGGPVYRITPKPIRNYLSELRATGGTS